MFKKILIANRGEIACRVMRTAKKLGIKCVAVYSDADATALHVKLADEAYRLGPAPSSESYLKGDIILQIAKATHAEAIHPGYGFLSENAEFAELCAKNKIAFIGPPPAAIRAMGSKSTAKKIMEQAQVPMVPGYHGADQTVATLQKYAEQIAYPLLIKAAAGGGGKGMRIVNKSAEFIDALASAKREALASFKDDTVLLEKYLTEPRHVEIQVFADTHGNVVHLFERDCSLQRRYQKVIEEAPAPNIPEKIRHALGEAAIAAARAINYVGAGTIEFLYDHSGEFYFMEMNTRLQVEHPVTEMITGLDLVEWQLRVAHGEKLPLTQSQITQHGHAFEARIYAEDPYQQFLPAIGPLIYLQTPHEENHVRVETGVAQGDAITPYYDPMIAKLCVWGETREIALQRFIHALENYRVVGLTTNLRFLLAIAAHPAFAELKLSTRFIEYYSQDLLQSSHALTKTEIAIACLYQLNKQKITADLPWQINDAWQMNLPAIQMLRFFHHEQLITVMVEHQDKNYQLQFDAESITAQTLSYTNNSLQIICAGTALQATVIEYRDDLHIFCQGKHQKISLYKIALDHGQSHKGGLTSPMPGTIVAIMVEAGQKVEQGTNLLIMEAMKMEHTIKAPSTGVIKELRFKVGDQVNEGIELLVLEME